MNKTVSIILIILLSLITIVATGLFIVLLKGDFKFNLFGFNSYSENLVDSKEYTNIEDIVINCDVGDIFIEESNEDKIKVELYSEDSDDYFIKEEDNEISIKLNAKKNKVHFFDKANRVIVKVPENYDKKVRVNTDTGDVIVASFSDMKLDIEGTTGDIKIEKVDTLDFKLKTGDVKADKLNYISGKVNTGDIKVGKAEEFSAATTTGDITIDNISKRVYAKTTTGDIKIDTAEIEEDSTISTETGDIKVEKLTGAYIEADTHTGDVKVNNNDRKLEKTITIKSHTGDIKVNR